MGPRRNINQGGIDVLNAIWIIRVKAVLFILGSCLLAPVVAAEPRFTLTLPEDTGSYSLAGTAELHEVPAQQSLTFTEMRAADALTWQRLDSHILDLSFNPNEHWVRFRVKNPGAFDQRLIFDVAQPLQDYIDVFVLQDGVIEGYWYTGNRRPMNSRAFNYRAMGFPLTLNAGTDASFYVRLNNYDGVYDSLPLNLTTEAVFFQNQMLESLGFGFYYGAIVILLFYNLVVGLVNRERAFILYSVYLGFFLAWNLAFQGYLALWPLQNHPDLHNMAVALFSIGIFAALVAFTYDFLQLKTRMPRAGKAMLWSSLLLLPLLVLALAGHYALVFALQAPAALIIMSFVLGAAVHQSCKGYPTARMFLAAWLLLIVAAVAHYGRLAGFFPSMWFFDNALNVGSLVEMLVLSYALAYRINELKKQQQQDQAYLITREQEMNETLQLRVASKTIELQALAKRLHWESVTDALTELHNRRTFFQTLTSELGRLSRSDDTLCLAVMDIDNFKEINDQFGHPEGDRQLVCMAEMIRRHWQRADDYCFRLGGDEFAIVFRANAFDLSHERLEQFQQETRELFVGPAGSDRVSLTVSIGVAIAHSIDAQDAQAFYARADNALYVSKAQGKDRIHIVSADDDDSERQSDDAPVTV